MMAKRARTKSARLNAIHEELDRAAAEFAEVKAAHEKALTHYNAARERFAVVKRIASGMLSFDDWYHWRESHPHVKYSGMTIGEAIVDALGTRAFVIGFEHDGKPDDFSPTMSIQEIADELEAGGFEFKGQTPLREVNAALMKLDGVTKLPSGQYQATDAQDILQFVKGEEPPKEEAEMQMEEAGP